MTSTDVLENKHGAENMRTAIIENKLKAAGIKFNTEQGFSGFTYTRIVFIDRQTAMKAEKVLNERATKNFNRWVMTFY